MVSHLKKNPLLHIIEGSLVKLPSPGNISYFWNFGSLLGVVLLLQILTGLFLAMSFSADTMLSFDVVVRIMRDVNLGWLIRVLHANGASFFFIFLYVHVARGIYYGSYNYKETWNLGVVLLLLVMGTAFLGYVLPWGQMSYWGASVITGLVSSIPYIGNEIVIWVWGGLSVENPTLLRFFSLHYLMPFVVAGIVMLHLLFLHQSGSNNPLGVLSEEEKLSFHPYFSFKDLYGMFFFLMILMWLVFFFPWDLGDPENFIAANPLVTPLHIQPEWYFLFAYAILRSIPNKFGGVVALVLSIMFLFILPFQTKVHFQGYSFYGPVKGIFWSWVVIVILLTWIGARPVEEPYVITGQILSVFYFSYYFIHLGLKNLWDKICA